MSLLAPPATATLTPPIEMRSWFPDEPARRFTGEECVAWMHQNHRLFKAWWSDRGNQFVEPLRMPHVDRAVDPNVHCIRSNVTRTIPGPNYNLQPVTDIATYIQRWRPEYRELLETLAGQAGPMHRACRITVCIPVAAADEAHHIAKTALSFSNQSLPFSDYEILFVLNGRRSVLEGRRSDVDATLHGIGSAMKKCPQLSIRVAHVTFDDNRKINFGFIRSLVSDLAIFRHWMRGIDDDHIITRTDADTESVDHRWTENYISCFDRHPAVDSFSGALYWSYEDQIQNSLFHINQHLDRALHHAVRVQGGIVPFGGPNFAIRASAYALLGGTRDLSNTGEDVELSRRLFEFRRGSTTHIPCLYAGFPSKLVTSSRRAMHAFKLGVPACLQWMSGLSDFNMDDASVRMQAQSCSEELNSRPELEEIGSILNRTWLGMQRLYPFLTLEMKSVHRAFASLALDLEIAGNSVVVTGMERYWAGFQEFQRKKKEELSIGSGRTGAPLACAG